MTRARWSSCGHSLLHGVNAAAEFGGVIGGDFVEAIPGALEGGHIDGEQTARFGEGAGLAAELDFVLAIGLAGMNGEELAAAKPGQVGEVEGAQGGAEVAVIERARGQTEPTLFGEAIGSEIFGIQVDGGQGVDIGKFWTRPLKPAAAPGD